MKSLLKHDAANTSLLWDVLLSMIAPNFETSDTQASAAVLLGGQAADVVLVCRSMASSGSGGCALFKCVSLQCHSVPCSVTASGPMRRPAAGSFFCFATHLPVTVSICDGPTVNAELRPWESRPLARLRPV